MEIYVEPDPAVRDDEARFAQMFARSRCQRADKPEDADLVILAGGSDVNPVLYGEERHNTTFFDDDRDQQDLALYQKCVTLGIPMFGVCRGAQFGWVMAGGKLIQDIDKHYGNHGIYDLNRKQKIDTVSSVHHQACLATPNIGAEIIATAAHATRRALNPKDSILGPRSDIEAYFIRDNMFLGVQGHPEYQGYAAFTNWCLELINEFIICNPDIEWRDGRRRVKEDLLLERGHIIRPPTPSITTPKTKKGAK
jgi:gamma-glutamyl-gamma-aminobutyrate hydrolase PuuD